MYAYVKLHMYVGVTSVFSRDILKGGIILACEPVVGGSWGCSIFWKIYYYCQSERGEDSSQVGEDSPLPPTLENTLRSSFQETKGYSPGVFFRGPKKCVEKSYPSESKRKEKLNGTCFSCIARLSRKL